MGADTQAMDVRVLSAGEIDAVSGGEVSMFTLGAISIFTGDGYFGIEIGHGAFGLSITGDGVHGHIGSDFF
jgi:hypothetical protein